MIWEGSHIMRKRNLGSSWDKSSPHVFFPFFWGLTYGKINGLQEDIAVNIEILVQLITMICTTIMHLFWIIMI
jgi:hypothetical protein